MKKLLKNKKGFTLVELLAVIVVLSVIMAIAAGAITSAIKTARNSSWSSNCDMLKKEAKRIATEKFLENDTFSCVLNDDDDDTKDCPEYFDVDATDYEELKVELSDNTYTLTVEASDSGEFSQVDDKTCWNDDGTTSWEQ